MTQFKAHELVDIDGNPYKPPAPTKAKPKPAPERRSYHMGWVVVGYPRGAIAAAQREHEEALSLWHAKEKERVGRGGKYPGLWSESMLPKPPRLHKPFFAPSAAQQFAEMAQREGYERIAVVELARGTAGGSLL